MMATAPTSTEEDIISVPAHATRRLTIHQEGKPDWVFTFARTGCLRVQRGDFTAYVPVEELRTLGNFITSEVGYSWE
jgi:hypothetical protein